MEPKKDTFNVLAVSRTAKLLELLTEILPQDQFGSMVHVTTAGEAKRTLLESYFPIVIIDTPLKEELGVQLALDISQQHSCSVILIVKNEVFEQVTYKVEDFGIVTLAKPTSKQAIYGAFKMVLAVQNRIRNLESKNINLKEKMQELRLLYRAKLLLIQHLGMTEVEAHRYIEKQAMDRCVKKIQIVENIIKTYEQ